MNSPSDFQITETPTLHFVATGDELRLSQDLQARLDDALRLAEEKAEVVAAAEAHRAASDRLHAASEPFHAASKGFDRA